MPAELRCSIGMLYKGALKKNCTNSHKKRKGGGSAIAPALCEVSSDPQTLPFFPLSATKAFGRLPLSLFRKVFVVRRLSSVFPSATSDVEENCLTPQLSSAVFRLVLEVKLYVFLSVRSRRSRSSIRCPMRALDFHHFGKPREGKLRFFLVNSSVPFPAPFTEVSCLQVSGKCPESLKMSSSLTSSWASFQFLFSSATGEQQKVKVRDSRDWRERTQANESDSFPDPIELAMSKHERRGANRRASGAKRATTTANGSNRRAREAGAKSATPTACVTSAEMALSLRQTSHSSGAALPPPFFFCGCWCNFFQRPLAIKK